MTTSAGLRIRCGNGECANADVAYGLLGYLERRTRSTGTAADVLAQAKMSASQQVESQPASVAERHRMQLFVTVAIILANRPLCRTSVTSTPVETAEPKTMRDVVLWTRNAQRELFRLIRWDGLAIVEAAEFLGMKPHAVGNPYVEARAVLREALNSSPKPVTRIVGTAPPE